MIATATRTLTVCGQPLRVHVRLGNGARVPLLMCSGIGTSFEVFDQMIDALDPGIEIIRVDVPGVGGSPVRAWPYGFPELARLLTKLLDELGYQQVDVLGFSWGGALAQQLAVQHPDRYRRLVLISTSPGLLSVPGRPEVLATLLTPKQFRSATDAAGLWYGGDVVDDAADLRRTFRDTRIGGSGVGYLYQLAALTSWSSLTILSHLRQPVLVMGGLGDRIVPVRNTRILAALIPNSTTHLYRGGHIDPLVSATVSAPIIDQFLAERPSPPRLTQQRRAGYWELAGRPERRRSRR